MFLLRHASHDRVDHVLCGRMPGVTLGEAGRHEAEWLAGEMARVGLAALHTSPLERCRQTVAPIARRTGLEPTAADAITEIDFGAWTGRRFDALQDDPAWRSWNAERDRATAPQGETMAAVQRRAVAHVERAATSHPGAAVALVSHSDVIKAVLSHYLGLSLQAYWRFEVSPASISELAVQPGHGRVVGINRRFA
jgi:broad specificity phosphatase PhoE